MYNNVFLVLVLSVFNNANSAKILGAVFTPSYSHQLAFQPIWRELSLRGHQVTVLTTNPMNDPTLSNLTEIDLSMSYEITKSYKTDELLSRTDESVIVRLKKYMAALHEVAEKQLAHPDVQNLLHHHRKDFDLLMVEAIYPTQMAFSWWFQIPFIGLISLDAPSRIHAAVGNPVHPVLYPAYDLPFDKNLTFLERLISSLHFLFMMWYEEYKLHPREDATIRKYFGSDAPSISEIQKNMSMLFINVNPIFHNIRPLVPTTIQIGGGIHLAKPKPLPNDIQQYLDNSENGFIYFSFGTNVKSASLQQEVKTAILQALGELSYNVLWKFEDQDFPNKPNNLKIVNWIPQTAVLAHQNIKGFITQGGLQSVEEAIFYHVPMIVVPFYGDQSHNAKIVASKGLGITLRSVNLNKEELLQAINNVTSNKLYKDNLQNIANLYNDVQITGLEKAVWWTEYVLRHNGTTHLKSPAVDLPLYQYYCIDIIGFILGLLSIIIFTIKALITLIKKLITGKKVKKE